MFVNVKFPLHFVKIVDAVNKIRLLTSQMQIITYDKISSNHSAYTNITTQE